MKKIFLIIISTVWFIFNDNKSKKEKNLKNVTMTIKDGTLTNVEASIIIKDLSGDNNTYGTSFRIDKKENNKWSPLEPIIKDYGFNTIGYHVDKNNILELDINWEWLYGKLKKGEYRLVKDVSVTKNNAYAGNEYIYTEFSIN